MPYLDERTRPPFPLYRIMLDRTKQQGSVENQPHTNTMQVYPQTKDLLADYIKKHLLQYRRLVFLAFKRAFGPNNGLF